ncbi:hypothetical protein Q5O24_12110 [Eubacteriaceae bacterium ES3]|nr:hypothetical protein Q5O24_12110 [Eubacteriaceae bacterium ES3]
MKRYLLVLVMVMALVFSFAGCSSQDAETASDDTTATTETTADDTTAAEESSDSSQASTAEFTIALEGVDGMTEFTQADLADLSLVEQTIILTKKDGTESGGTFEGYLLKDVIATLGITDYTAITMEASDGYTKDYEPATVEAEDSLLTVSLDGEALISVVTGSKGAGSWVQGLSKMTVVK